MSLAEVESKRAQPSQHVAVLPASHGPNPRARDWRAFQSFMAMSVDVLGYWVESKELETVMTKPPLKLSSLDHLLAEC